ncbi:MAG: hypothetical protein IPM32_10860 [Ignavibacteriae bacterium]|nr:hypothetical protein [Ignavibacteriota bacterium]
MKSDPKTNCENLTNNIWEKTISYYHEDHNGVSRNDYTRFTIDFYRNGEFYFGIYELPNMPTGKYICNNDTLKLFSETTTEYFIIKFQSAKLELIKIKDKNSLEKNKLYFGNLEGVWNRKKKVV